MPAAAILAVCCSSGSAGIWLFVSWLLDRESWFLVLGRFQNFRFGGYKHEV